MSKKQANTTIDAELLEEADALAWSVGSNRSEIFERAIRAYLESVLPGEANDDGTVLERYRKRRTVEELPTKLGGQTRTKVEKKGFSTPSPARKPPSPKPPRRQVRSVSRAQVRGGVA